MEAIFIHASVYVNYAPTNISCGHNGCQVGFDGMGASRGRINDCMAAFRLQVESPGGGAREESRRNLFDPPRVRAALSRQALIRARYFMVTSKVFIWINRAFRS